MAKRGPDPKGEYADKSAVLSTRIQQATREMLIEAKNKSGRSLSQEIEHRLRRSLDEDEKIEERFGDRRSYAAFRLCGIVTDLQSGGPNAPHWLDDAYKFDQVLLGIASVLKHFRPKNSPPVPEPAPADDAIGESWNEAFATVREIGAMMDARDVLIALQKSSDHFPARWPRKHKNVLQYIRRDLSAEIDRLDEQSIRADEAAAAAKVQTKRKVQKPSPKRGSRS